jgi:GNAT superfamily N-acetyltransferase
VHRRRHGRGGSVRDFPLTDRYIIREARPDEAGLFAAIEIAAARLFAVIGQPEIEAHTRREQFPVDLIAERIEAGSFMAVELDGNPIGFAAADERDGLCHLMELAVHPDHAGKRLGARLIDKLEIWARAQALPAITLSTFVDVPWNAPYYARLGFRMFPREDWGPRHLRTWDAQAKDGVLDMSRRCFMIRDVTR